MSATVDLDAMQAALADQPDNPAQDPPMPDVSNLPATTKTPPPSPEQLALAQMQGGQSQPQQQAQPQQPIPTPILASLIGGLIRPPQTQPDAMGVTRPASRLDVFENFLTNFVTALGSGLAAAHGPGAFGKGFGAAVTAPYAQAVGQYQLGQQAQAQQAGIAESQAKTAQTEAQTKLMQTSVPVTLPNGQTMYIPMSQAGPYLGNYFKSGYAADVAARSRITVEQLKEQAQSGQVARVLPGIDPQSNQPAMLAYDKQNRLVGVVPGAFNPATLPKISTNQEWIQTSPGVWDVVNKTSTTQTVVPGASPSGFPRTSGTPQASGSNPPAPGPYANVPKINPRRRIVGDDPGVALDQNNQLVQTTASEAAQKGYQNFTKATSQEFDKYRTAQAQFNDVTLNVSRYYAAAARAEKKPPSYEDYANLHAIMNKVGPADLKVSVSEGGDVNIPGLSALLEGLSRESRSEAYAALSPQAKDLLDGYQRTMAAVPAYMKALTQSGRFTKEQMELELQQIGNPTWKPADIRRRLDQFQENIAVGSSSIPRMKGMQTIWDIRKQYNPDVNATQPRKFPQNVPVSPFINPAAWPGAQQ